MRRFWIRFLVWGLSSQDARLVSDCRWAGGTDLVTRQSSWAHLSLHPSSDRSEDKIFCCRCSIGPDASQSTTQASPDLCGVRGTARAACSEGRNKRVAAQSSPLPRARVTSQRVGIPMGYIWRPSKVNLRNSSAGITPDRNREPRRHERVLAFQDAGRSQSGQRVRTNYVVRRTLPARRYPVTRSCHELVRMADALVQVELQTFRARCRMGLRRVGFDPRPDLGWGTAHVDVEPLTAGETSRRAQAEQRHQPAKPFAACAI